ncbi:hypothetical protein D3C72_2178720 [compost metagenome]
MPLSPKPSPLMVCNESPFGDDFARYSVARTVILSSAFALGADDCVATVSATLGILKTAKSRGFQLIIPFHLPPAISSLYFLVIT